MDALSELIDGFGTVLEPANLLYALAGVLLGTFVGVLPGIGPALTIALLLPLTFNFDDPTGAFILFAGIYFGGMYGGSTTSILLNTPGESGSVATAIEGFEMAKRGRAKPALATAAIGSFVAGTIGLVLLTFLAQPIADLAVGLQPADYFALVVLAFVAVTALIGRSVIRGLLSLGLGLAIGLIGIDQLTGQARLTFGVDQLFAGVDIVIVAVGLFAIGEALHMASRVRRGGREEEHAEVTGSQWLGREDLGRSWKPWLRGTAFGFPFGAMPTGGAEIPTFLSYATERRLVRGKAKEEFGKGAIEGVAGPEAANNAAFTGVLVPLRTIGIPTSATAAILLASFQIFDLQPGPQLFEREPDLVWALIASLYVGNVMLLVLNLPLIRLWVKVLQIPRPMLYTAILVFATLGVYSISGSVVEVLIAYAIGVLGFGMRRYDFPIAPVILGVILGPLAELQLRRTLLVSDGDWTALVDRPFAAAVLAVALLAFVIPLAPRVIARLRGERFEGRKVVFGEED
ncbi:MAG: tripartite tricarboxylate transporter permease [Solirubrobacteraceae bacterium]